MIDWIELTEVGPAQHLRVDFARRLTVFAGDNGLGKSFLLEVAWWVLTGRWAREPALPRSPAAGPPAADPRMSGRRNGSEFSVSYLSESGSWSGMPGKATRSRDALVIFAQSDGGFCLSDPYKGGAPLILSAEDVWSGKRLRNRPVCRGMIEDWRSWMEGEKNVFARFETVLDRLSPDRTSDHLTPGPLRKLSIDYALEVPTLATPYGHVPITQASAGVKRGLGLAYMLVWAWREHRKTADLVGRPPVGRLVLLFDEVEAHLHPKWQRVMLPAVLDVLGLLEFQEAQVVAVTHAPLVLASLETRFDPALDTLFKFDLDGDKVVAEHMDWRLRGDVSAWLTSEVFDLGAARSLEAERAILEARAACADPALPLDEIRRIHHGLHAVLKETDPFWARWLARAAAAGIDP